MAANGAGVLNALYHTRPAERCLLYVTVALCVILRIRNYEYDILQQVRPCLYLPAPATDDLQD
jgi:hypothetical protein